MDDSSIHTEGGQVVTTVKNGRIHLVFLGGIFLLLLLGGRFVEEQSEFRYRRSEMESLLAFDYRLEAYYLLILSNELIIEEGVSYGGLEEYEVSEKPEGEFLIEIRRNPHEVEVVGYYAGEERQKYLIKQESGFSTD